MFVGDSLSRNQWQSLTCMLHSSASVPNPQFNITRQGDVSTFTFSVPSSNPTHHWSPRHKRYPTDWADGIGNGNDNGFITTVGLWSEDYAGSKCVPRRRGARRHWQGLEIGLDPRRQALEKCRRARLQHLALVEPQGINSTVRRPFSYTNHNQLLTEG